jgi:hypothetical protein
MLALPTHKFRSGILALISTSSGEQLTTNPKAATERVDAPVPDRVHPHAMKPGAASGGSIFANFDVLDDGEDAAGRTGARRLNLAIVALGLSVIGALAFAWSNADGRLRFELQSATAPKSAQRAAAPEEIERLRGVLDALKNDVKELTDTQHQAAHTIAAMKAAEEDLRRHVPPPYWYSNPVTLDLAIAKQPPPAGFAPPPRRR